MRANLTSGSMRGDWRGGNSLDQSPTLLPTKFLLSELATKSLVVDTTRHRPNLILALLCAAQFMLILDIAIVNVALPSMQRTLSLSAENIQWVVSGYALTFGGFLMLGGQRKPFVGGYGRAACAPTSGATSYSSIVLTLSASSGRVVRGAI